MKKCPICNTLYDDSLNFCTKDGHQLKNVETPVETQKPEDTGETRPKKKNGCLKKIIIGFVVVIIGLVVLNNYLKNAATYLRVEPNEVHAIKAGGSCKVDIDYDGFIWTVNHQPEWVDINEKDKDFDLVVRPNRTGQMREGSITIQSGKFLAQVVVRQNAFATIMKASETSLTFSKSGGKEDVAIETDGCNWEADYTSWMEVTRKSENELKVTCPRNDGEYRTGTINVKEDNARVVIYVTQGGDCNNCHGNGEVTCGSCYGMGGMGFGMYPSSCLSCGGDGKVPCGLCNGTGVRE